MLPVNQKKESSDTGQSQQSQAPVREVDKIIQEVAERYRQDPQYYETRDSQRWVWQ